MVLKAVRFPMRNRLFLLPFMALVAVQSDQSSARSANPFDCSGVNRYPFMVAITELQNKGKLNTSDVDFKSSKSTTIATRQIKRNLQRQVLMLEIHTKDNNNLEVMVINYASREECSMGGVKVYLISKL